MGKDVRDMVKEELVKLLRSYNENKSKLFIRKREKCTLEELKLIYQIMLWPH